VRASKRPPARCVQLTEAGEVSFAERVASPGLRMESWTIPNQPGSEGACSWQPAMHAGRRRFAQSWMQRLGLTWAFRLWNELLRLGREPRPA
jgi:hypothetical protein